MSTAGAREQGRRRLRVWPSVNTWDFEEWPVDEWELPSWRMKPPGLRSLACSDRGCRMKEVREAPAPAYSEDLLHTTSSLASPRPGRRRMGVAVEREPRRRGLDL
ncbi:unnamed protein product [Pleuronectes platessa]|uniref:Uncharacterized protein n=1 Tax=Pleuronectes platessa TaxID=8262 RepID=A0A9N7UR23_PLEPL|nr:unnamed protein product [Pleuronectes platessa]